MSTASRSRKRTHDSSDDADAVKSIAPEVGSAIRVGRPPPLVPPPPARPIPPLTERLGVSSRERVDRVTRVAYNMLWFETIRRLSCSPVSHARLEQAIALATNSPVDTNLLHAVDHVREAIARSIEEAICADAPGVGSGFTGLYDVVRSFF